MQTVTVELNKAQVEKIQAALIVYRDNRANSGLGHAAYEAADLWDVFYALSKQFD